MNVTITLCALMLAIGVVQEDGKKTEAPATPKVEQATRPQAAQQTRPIESKPAAEAKPAAQSQPNAAAAQATAQPAAAPAGLEEQEINGVKLAVIEANIVSYTNQERARHGLPPLKVDPNLMESARQHASWMTRNRAMVHTNRPVAENIAMGQPHSSDVVRSWMKSPGHRANILNFAHRVIGVAAFRTDNGTIYWCQQFRP